nr:unnamed protein product [Mus musculus]
MAGDIS